jgi:hypothetical protein
MFEWRQHVVKANQRQRQVEYCYHLVAKQRLLVLLVPMLSSATLALSPKIAIAIDRLTWCFVVVDLHVVCSLVLLVLMLLFAMQALPQSTTIASDRRAARFPCRWQDGPYLGILDCCRSFSELHPW